MRHIGNLATQQLARRFTDFLTTLGVSAVAEPEQDVWSIWIRDEDQVDRSRSALRDFAVNPDAEAYLRATAEAQRVREVLAKKERDSSKNRVEMREVWNQPLFKRAPLMATLIGITTLVFVLTGTDFTAPSGAASALGFFDPVRQRDAAWQLQPNPFVDIRQGEVWRLLTPIFLHQGFPHFFFNMYMLYILGGAIELRHGPGRLALVVIASGILGNVGEYLLNSQVMRLGGMSGVDYGLLGYLWIRGVLFPQDRLLIRRETVVVMLAYLLLGFTGVLNYAMGTSIANFAHLFGLIGGMSVAYIYSWLPKSSKK